MLWQGRFTSPDMVCREPFDVGRGASFASNQGAEKAPLDTTAKSVGRSDRFRWQRHAAKLLHGQGRVGLCRWTVASKTKGVDMVSSSYQDGKRDRVHYEGTQTCGSVWLCPCCGARISETRRGELNRLLSWARGEGYQISMITLTARHGRDDDLRDLLEKMKDAKRRWVQRRDYKAIRPQIIGSVTATEVTGGGGNGWHPHFHVVMITEPGTDLSPLREAWLGALRGAGLEGTGAGWSLQDAAEAGRYVAKWGAAEELALKDQKKGRAGRSPAQLLAASCDDGDTIAAALWAEYADVFHGRRQLVWSRGLKAAAGVDDVDDQEAAQDEQQDGQIETGRTNIPHPVWTGHVAAHAVDAEGKRVPVDRRAELLDRAEEIGTDAALSEIIGGHFSVDVLDLVEPPRPGGLVEAALAAIWPPLGHGP